MERRVSGMSYWEPFQTV